MSAPEERYPWPFPAKPPEPAKPPPQDGVDLDSDAPLECPLRKPGDGETCESCQ